MHMVRCSYSSHLLRTCACISCMVGPIGRRTKFFKFLRLSCPNIKQINLSCVLIRSLIRINLADTFEVVFYIETQNLLAKLLMISPSHLVTLAWHRVGEIGELGIFRYPSQRELGIFRSTTERGLGLFWAPTERKNSVTYH